MSETLIEQMRRTWAQADHDSGAPMYWSLTPDAYDRLRYETRHGEVWQEGDQPSFMGFPIYRGGSGIPQFMLLPGEPPDDQRESELRRQLSVIQREYYERRLSPCAKERAGGRLSQWPAFLGPRLISREASVSRFSRLRLRSLIRCPLPR